MAEALGPAAVQAASSSLIRAMAPMKAMKKAGPLMTKGGLAQSIADELEMKKKDVTTVLDSLASIAATEVKKAGKFTIPGVAMVKTRLKPATKAGKDCREGVRRGRAQEVRLSPPRPAWARLRLRM